MNYNNYIQFIQKILESNDLTNFKSNPTYNIVLEHVSAEDGEKYLKNIEKYFPTISTKNIKDFIKINDSIGNPKKALYFASNQDIIYCSPTTLRYIFHSLFILKYIASCKVNKIVEVGCGYGGLYLAISFFSKILDIDISKYYMIDLDHVCKLIEKYLSLNSSYATIPYQLCDAISFGNDIIDDNIFFISNYCFTELEENLRKKYINILLPKVSSGFIIWQTSFNCPISLTYTLNKNIIKIEEEIPNFNMNKKNYFVYF